MTRIPSKTPAAKHAQMRRDNEIEAREAVRILIPNQYFTEEAQDMNQLNPSSRVFVAMRKYLESNESKNQVGHTTLDAKSKDKRLSLIAKGPSAESTKEAFQQLRQIANRLTQKAEEKVQAGENVSNLKHVFELISDSMIDAIKTIEDA